MRALVDISISYDENIDEAMQVLQQVCEQVPLDQAGIEIPFPHQVYIEK